MESCFYDSPLGYLHIASDDDAIVKVSFCDEVALYSYYRIVPPGKYPEFRKEKETAIPHGFSLSESESFEENLEEAFLRWNVSGVLQKCLLELDSYFAGKLKVFTVPIKLAGTDFRMRCWEALSKIPYGETVSYGQLADRIGNPKASRAVGGANHHNPIAVIVPCHRVIGADGSLTGFGGGLDKKRFLLELERTHR